MGSEEFSLPGYATRERETLLISPFLKDLSFFFQKDIVTQN
jgi:hypothetical protein